MNTTADPNVGQSSAPTKNILTSKTLWFTVITAIAMFYPHLFANLGFSGDNADFADKVTAVVGVFGTIYGRWKAGGLHVFLS